jgi:hypothetical protein
MSSPNIPSPPPPPQEAKQPDSMAVRRRQRQGSGMASPTLLTGPGGVPSSGYSTGGTSLLGG